MIRTRSHLRLATGLAVATLGLAVATLGLAGASAASAASAPVPPPTTAVNLSPTQVATALFVAGDVGRESQIPSGTEDVVLEKVLQQLYTNQPSLSATQAITDIQSLQTTLTTRSQALSAATLTVMPGNERILALLDELNNSLPPTDVAHAVAQVTAQALSDSSSAKQVYGLPFDPSADARDTLSYTSFSPAATLARTAALAATNKTFGKVRDGLWQRASSESVYENTKNLVNENPALKTNTAIAALLKLLAPNGTLSTTVGALEGMINNGITQINNQNCTPTGSSGATSSCSAGALHDAQAVAQQCPGQTCQTAVSQAETDAPNEVQTIAAQQAAMAAESDALGAAGQALQQSESAAAQAAAEIGDEENQYLNYQSDQQTEKAGFDVATLAVTLSVAEVDPVAAATGLFTVLGDAIGFAQSAQDPSQILLQGIGNISQQLAGFENYTQTAFNALDTQLSSISSQISTLTSQLSTDFIQVEDQLGQVKVQLGNLDASVSTLQNSVDQLQSEVQSLFSTTANNDLYTVINRSIGYQQTFKHPISSDAFAMNASDLFSDATGKALSSVVLSGITGFDVTHAATNLGTATSSPFLDANINYFNDYPGAVTDSQNILWAPNQLTSVCASSLGLAGACLPDPDFWATSARAYAQLLMENPTDVTQLLLTKLGLITQEGQLVANGLQQLSVDNASTRKTGTGNQTLDAALSYYENWGGVPGAPGEPGLTQALSNEEQSYLASTDPSVPVAYGKPLSDAQINPWGGASQSPDLTGLLTTTSFTNVPLCASEVSELGAFGVNPSNYTLPQLTSQIIGFLPRDVLNAARLGIGQLSTCYTAELTGGVSAQDMSLAAGIVFHYTPSDNPQVHYVIGTISATAAHEALCAAAGVSLTGNQDLDGINEVRVNWPNWPGVSTTQYPGCANWSNTLGQPQNQTAPDGGFQQVVDPQLKQALAGLQTGIYNDIINGLTSGSGVEAAAQRFGAATALLNGYVSLGLPQSLATDDTLHSLVSGDGADAFASGDSTPSLKVAYAADVPAEVVAFYKAALQRLPSVDPAQLVQEVINAHVQQLTNAIRPHIVAAQAPAGGILAEINPVIGATIDRLDDTCAALQDSLGKTGADCSGATTTTAASLKSVANRPTTAHSARRTVTQHASK